MASPEKIVLVFCLFGGFLWLRQRSRIVDLENQMLRAILGVFVLLPSALIGEKFLFEMLHYNLYLNIVIKATAIIGTFAIVGLGFLRSGPLAGSSDSANATEAVQKD